MRLEKEGMNVEIRRYPTHTAVITIDDYDIGLVLDPDAKDWHYDHAKRAVVSAGFLITPSLDAILRREFGNDA